VLIIVSNTMFRHKIMTLMFMLKTFDKINYILMIKSQSFQNNDGHYN